MKFVYCVTNSRTEESYDIALSSEEKANILQRQFPLDIELQKVQVFDEVEDAIACIFPQYASSEIFQEPVRIDEPVWYRNSKEDDWESGHYAGWGWVFSSGQTSFSQRRFISKCCPNMVVAYGEINADIYMPPPKDFIPTWAKKS